MRYQKPISGNIAINDIGIDEFNIKTYRSKIGYVPQEPFLYDGTILDNIYWANPKINEEQIDKILDISNCKNLLKVYQMELIQMLVREVICYQVDKNKE